MCRASPFALRPRKCFMDFYVLFALSLGHEGRNCLVPESYVGLGKAPSYCGVGSAWGTLPRASAHWSALSRASLWLLPIFVSV